MSNSKFNNALIIFAKAPRPGHVKTRLQPFLPAEGAAALYRAFLHDLLDTATALPDVQCLIAFPPRPGAEEHLRKIFASHRELSYFTQAGMNLGERLAAAFQLSHEEGWKKTVLIASDSPTLPGRFIAEAFAALAHSDLVLGPCTDGGYYLLGMRDPHPEIFRGIDWGTPLVLRQTMTNIRALGLRLYALPPWYDVDCPDDVHFLLGHLDLLEVQGEPVPQATAAWLRSFIAGV